MYNFGTERFSFTGKNKQNISLQHVIRSILRVVTMTFSLEMNFEKSEAFSPFINLVFADQPNLSVNITIIVPLSLKSSASEVDIHQVFQARISALIRDVTSFIENNVDQKPLDNKIEIKNHSETKFLQESFSYLDDLPPADVLDNNDSEDIGDNGVKPTVIGFKRKEKKENRLEYKTGHIEISCETCGEIVKKSKLHNHIQKHHTPKELCLNCGKYFTQSYYNTKHFYKCNNLPNPKYPEEEEGSHICQHCGKEFKFKVYLDNHVKYVHREETFMCSQCDFKCKVEYQLKIHIRRRHTKYAEVKCEICHKTYANTLQLK